VATYRVTYWQEIPSQVDAKAPGQKPHREPLSQQFLELIDIIASKRKQDSADDYLAGWNKGSKVEREGSADQVAKEVAAEFEAKFEAIRAQAISQS